MSPPGVRWSSSSSRNRGGTPGEPDREPKKDMVCACACACVCVCMCVGACFGYLFIRVVVDYSA